MNDEDWVFGRIDDGEELVAKQTFSPKWNIPNIYKYRS